MTDGGSPGEQEAARDLAVVVEEIASIGQLKDFLNGIRSQLNDKVAPPIYALTAMNYIFRQAKLYELFDKDNREVAREIWLALQQSGLHLRRPPLLFADDDPSTAT